MSFAENLQDAINKAVNAELERRIPLLAKELDVDEKKIRKIFGTKLKVEEKTEKKIHRQAGAIDTFDDGKMRIIIDYDTNHILCIGKKATMSIKETIIKPLGIDFRKNWDYGPGWRLKKEQLQDLLKKLDKMKGKSKIEYIELTRDEMDDFVSHLEDGNDSDLEEKVKKSEKKMSKTLRTKKDDSDSEKEEKAEKKKEKKEKKKEASSDSEDEEKNTKTRKTLDEIKKKVKSERQNE